MGAGHFLTDDEERRLTLAALRTTPDGVVDDSLAALIGWANRIRGAAMLLELALAGKAKVCWSSDEDQPRFFDSAVHWPELSDLTEEQFSVMESDADARWDDDSHRLVIEVELPPIALAVAALHARPAALASDPAIAAAAEEARQMLPGVGERAHGVLAMVPTIDEKLGRLATVPITVIGARIESVRRAETDWIDVLRDLISNAARIRAFVPSEETSTD